MQKTCPFCLVKFEEDILHPNKIYCSEAHRKYAWKKRNWGKVLEYARDLARKKSYKPRKRKCKECKKWYLPTKYNPYQKYCNWYCRNKAFKRLNPEKVKEYKKSDRLRHKDYYTKMNIINHDRIRFGGNRRKVMERDLFTCVDCGQKYPDVNLIVHHMDRNKGNNQMSNLKTLCRSCHLKEHKEEIFAKRHPTS